jgi:hypothetical protein
LRELLYLAAMPTAGFPALGKEKIQNFGKVYDYLEETLNKLRAGIPLPLLMCLRRR